MPPGVRPPPTMAQDADASTDAVNRWAIEAAGSWFGSAYSEGMMFLGYSILAALAQRAEYRVASEEIASEMTREWIDIKRSGEKEKGERVRQLEGAIRELNLQEELLKAVEYDGLMGCGHLFLDVAEEGKTSADQGEELRTSIGDGRDSVSRGKIGKRVKLVGVRAIEPTWTWPNEYNTSNPLHPDWYRPQTWSVMGKTVHRTRLLTLVGRPVPDLLKPAYAFGGLSMTQMLKPYVDNWLRTRQSTSDLVHSFSTQVLATNLDAANKVGGGDIFKRIEFFNLARDNAGVMVIDRDSEEWFNVQTSLGGLHELQAQAQEHMAAIARIPLVKLLGIQPSGLNASSEGEIRSFYDWIKAFQNRLLRRPIEVVLAMAQLSLWGEVDPDITFDFNPLWQLDDQQRATVEATKAQTHSVYVQSGVVGPEEVRESLASDPDSPYDGVDLSGSPPRPGGAPQQEMPPGFEDQGEDGEEEVGLWARRAAAMFEDQGEVEYWGRAAEAAGHHERLPAGRWRALAEKLHATSNAGEAPEVWEGRVLVLREEWPRRAPVARSSWVERAAFVGGEPEVIPAGKRSKDEVSYEFPAAREETRCRRCRHFQPGDHPKTCALVGGGVIEPEGWCELWSEAPGDGDTHRSATLAAADASWKEEKHHRGQPGNAGQFSSSGSAVSRGGSTGSGGRRTDKTSEFSTTHAYKNAGMEKVMARHGYNHVDRLEWYNPQLNVSVVGRPGGYFEIQVHGGERLSGKGAPALEALLGKVKAISLREDSRLSVLEKTSRTAREMKSGKFGLVEAVRRIAGDVSQHLDYSERAHTITVASEPYDFDLNGQKMTAGGTSNPLTGEIKIYPVMTVSPMDIAPLLAHEIMHQKFESVWNEYYDQRREALDASDWSGINHRTGAVTKPEIAAEYPMLADISPILGSEDAVERLEKDDGITDYSREYWKAYDGGRGTVNFKTAVNETLAEMSRLALEGSLTRLIWYKNSETWKPLYHAVIDHYRGAHEARKRRLDTSARRDLT